MIKIIPILLGVVGSYVVAAIAGQVDFTPVAEAAWIGLPLPVAGHPLRSVQPAPTWTPPCSSPPPSPSCLWRWPTMVEHIGDICAISSTCERNYL